MGREIDRKTKEIIHMAKTEAMNYGDSKLKPEHILMSSLLDEENSVIKVLKIMGVDIDKLINTVGDYLTNSYTSPPILGATTYQVISPDNTVKQILRECELESNGLNSENIDICHIILSMLKLDINVTKILNKFNINYINFKKALMLQNEEKMSVIGEDDEYDLDNLRNNSVKNKALKSESTDNSQKRTPILDNFSRDITQAAKDGQIDQVVGREKEIKRVAQILARRKKNNPIIIGEPGVGKTSIVEGLGLLIHQGKAPSFLSNKRIVELDLTSLVSGTKYRGQFEERIKAIMNELKTNKNVILFIDEIHTIMGAGNSSDSLSLPNIFKPALSRGELHLIGATTLDEYRETIETDGALTRRFQEVILDEPDFEDTVTIMTNIKDYYENFHKVEYSEEVIYECVKLADRYISDRAMPDKAIDIMDEVGASANVDIEVPSHIIEMENKLAEVVNQKRITANKQEFEVAAQLRNEEKDLISKINQAKQEWEDSSKNKRTPITIEMVESVVSIMTGIPLDKISVSENLQLANMEKELSEIVIGQNDAVTKVSKAIRRSRLGVRKVDKPIASFVFLGPTGVGKTHLAKKLAEYVFGSKDSLIRFDMSEYGEKFTVSRLIGAPPGYIGYEEGGKLTEAVRRKPYSVVLFDEIEKAHPDIFNIMLQMLDEGMLTDGLGRTVDFKNTLIILTSNVGVAELVNNSGIGFSTSNSAFAEEERVKTFLDKAMKKKFPPEFLNRIDETIVFKNLTSENIQEIIVGEIESVVEGLDELGYNLKVSKPAMEFIAKEGYDPQFGARPLKRAIQRYVEDIITDEIMSGNASEGDTIKIGYSENKGGITVTIEKP